MVPPKGFFRTRGERWGVQTPSSRVTGRTGRRAGVEGEVPLPAEGPQLLPDPERVPGGPAGTDAAGMGRVETPTMCDADGDGSGGQTAGMATPGCPAGERNFHNETGMIMRQCRNADPRRVAEEDSRVQGGLCAHVNVENLGLVRQVRKMGVPQRSPAAGQLDGVAVHGERQEGDGEVGGSTACNREG